MCDFTLLHTPACSNQRHQRNRWWMWWGSIRRCDIQSRGNYRTLLLLIYSQRSAVSEEHENLTARRSAQLSSLDNLLVSLKTFNFNKMFTNIGVSAGHWVILHTSPAPPTCVYTPLQPLLFQTFLLNPLKEPSLTNSWWNKLGFLTCS